MRVVFLSAARDDLWRQIDWLEDASPDAARRAEQAIMASTRTLSEYPYIGLDIGNGRRERTVKLGLHGLVIRYRVTPERIEILRMFHSAQDRSED